MQEVVALLGQVKPSPSELEGNFYIWFFLSVNSTSAGLCILNHKKKILRYITKAEIKFRSIQD